MIKYLLSIAASITILTTTVSKAMEFDDLVSLCIAQPETVKEASLLMAEMGWLPVSEDQLQYVIGLRHEIKAISTIRMYASEKVQALKIEDVFREVEAEYTRMQPIFPKMAAHLIEQRNGQKQINEYYISADGTSYIWFFSKTCEFIPTSNFDFHSLLPMFLRDSFQTGPDTWAHNFVGPFQVDGQPIMEISGSFLSDQGKSVAAKMNFGTSGNITLRIAPYYDTPPTKHIIHYRQGD